MEDLCQDRWHHDGHQNLTPPKHHEESYLSTEIHYRHAMPKIFSETGNVSCIYFDTNHTLQPQEQPRMSLPVRLL
jgi:hypothetical protein